MAVVVLVDLARRGGRDEVLARADGVLHADRRRRRRRDRRARPPLGEGRHGLAAPAPRAAERSPPTASDRLRTVTVRDESVDDRPARRAPSAGRSRVELGVSEITASVLVRRGYDEPEAARRFLDAELPGHDPFLLGDMEVAVERIRAAIADGTRICVHGDYDVDGICATALAVLVLRELGADVAWHLPSRFEEGYGVSRETLGAARRRRRRARPHRRLRDHGGRGGRRGEGSAASRSSSPTTTGRATCCPTARSSRRGRRRYPFPELCGTGVVYKLGEALLGADHPARSSGTSISSRSRRSPTSSRSSTRTARSRPPGLRALAATSRPGLQALMRSARVDPAAVDSGAVGFRLAPRINAAGRLGRPDVALELVLTEDADEARRLADDARGAEPRSPGGRGPDPARGDRGRRRDAGAAAAAARLRPLERGLARGRDRDRRVAPRRALPPAGRPHRALARRLEGLGTLDRALRPPRRARRLLGASRALRRPPRGRGALDRPSEASTAFAEASPRTPTRTSMPTTSFEVVRVDAVVSAQRSHARARARSSSGSRRSVSATPTSTLLVPATRGRDAGDRGRGEAPALPRAPARPRRRERDRVRPGRAARPAARGRAASTSRSA